MSPLSSCAINFINVLFLLTQWVDLDCVHEIIASMLQNLVIDQPSLDSSGVLL